MGHETEYSEELIKVLEEVNVLHSSIEEATGKRPYHINVIDELHANENAHSRILNKLLSYPKGSEYPILLSFIKKMKNWDENIVIECPKFSNEQERIDCLIQEEKKYAIIIENKIHDAVDQEKQLEKYINIVKNHVPYEHIWVVYLTRDGRKEPETYSLTEKAKRMVGNRFTPLNYRFDILPWLREEVLPSCMIKEEWLISAIKQYIDHLEGMFQERKDDEKYNNTMKEIINKQFELENLTDKEIFNRLLEEEKRIEKVRDSIRNYRMTIDKKIIDAFTHLTKNYFAQDIFTKYGKFTIVDCHGDEGGYYQIRPEKWPTCIHLEWIPFGMKQLLDDKSLTIVLHIEGSPNDEKLKRLKEKIHNDLEYQKIPKDNLNGKTTFYKKNIELNMPFASLPDDEKRDVLHKTYSETEWLIALVEKYWNNY